MAVKVYKPTSPGRRDMSGHSFEEVTRSKPEKSLVSGLRKSGGRNFRGKITIRHRGGGHKRRYRQIDFRRDKKGVPARVASIEYDPNRSARIALLNYADGEKRYIIAPLGLRVGDTVLSDERTEIRPGNVMPLSNIPMGTQVHNIELKPGKGGQIARAAGACRPARNASFVRNVRPPLARSATSNMATSSWVKPVVSGIWASARQFAVRRWTRPAIPMVVVKGVHPSAWLLPRPLGASPHWVNVRARTSAPKSTSSVVVRRSVGKEFGEVRNVSFTEERAIY